MLDLVSRGTSKTQIFRYAAGWVRRTLAMAFSPCLEKSRSSAQITASLSLLREPGVLSGRWRLKIVVDPGVGYFKLALGPEGM